MRTGLLIKNAVIVAIVGFSSFVLKSMASTYPVDYSTGQSVITEIDLVSNLDTPHLFWSRLYNQNLANTSSIIGVGWEPAIPKLVSEDMIQWRTSDIRYTNFSKTRDSLQFDNEATNQWDSATLRKSGEDEFSVSADGDFLIVSDIFGNSWQFYNFYWIGSNSGDLVSATYGTENETIFYDYRRSRLHRIRSSTQQAFLRYIKGDTNTGKIEKIEWYDSIDSIPDAQDLLGTVEYTYADTNGTGDIGYKEGDLILVKNTDGSSDPEYKMYRYDTTAGNEHFISLILSGENYNSFAESYSYDTATNTEAALYANTQLSYDANDRVQSVCTRNALQNFAASSYSLAYTTPTCITDWTMDVIISHFTGNRYTSLPTGEARRYVFKSQDLLISKETSSYNDDIIVKREYDSNSRLTSKYLDSEGNYVLNDSGNTRSVSNTSNYGMVVTQEYNSNGYSTAKRRITPGDTGNTVFKWGKDYSYAQRQDLAPSEYMWFADTNGGPDLAADRFWWFESGTAPITAFESDMEMSFQDLLISGYEKPEIKCLNGEMPINNNGGVGLVYEDCPPLAHKSLAIKRVHNQPDADVVYMRGLSFSRWFIPELVYITYEGVDWRTSDLTFHNELASLETATNVTTNGWEMNSAPGIVLQGSGDDIIEFTNPGNQTRTLFYSFDGDVDSDLRGKLKTIITAEGRVRNYIYDDDTGFIEEINIADQKAVFTWDTTNNRITEIEWLDLSDNSLGSVEYTYAMNNVVHRLNNLILVDVSDGTNHAYASYYADCDGDIDFLLEGENYERFVADGYNYLTTDRSIADDYANIQFFRTYPSHDRVNIVAFREPKHNFAQSYCLAGSQMYSIQTTPNAVQSVVGMSNFNGNKFGRVPYGYYAYMSYNKNGDPITRATRSTYGDDRVWHYTYYANGMLKRLYSPDCASINWSTQQVTVTPSAGTYKEWVYNENNNVESIWTYEKELPSRVVAYEYETKRTSFVNQLAVYPDGNTNGTPEITDYEVTYFTSSNTNGIEKVKVIYPNGHKAMINEGNFYDLHHEDDDWQISLVDPYSFDEDDLAIVDTNGTFIWELSEPYYMFDYGLSLLHCLITGDFMECNSDMMWAELFDYDPLEDLESLQVEPKNFFPCYIHHYECDEDGNGCFLLWSEERDDPDLDLGTHPYYPECTYNPQ